MVEANSGQHLLEFPNNICQLGKNCGEGWWGAAFGKGSLLLGLRHSKDVAIDEKYDHWG